MSQNSLVINDASGAAVLSAINAALDTLASNNGGAGAPAVTYPYMWWPDTANGVLRQCNKANTGWIVRGSLAETLVVARTANTALAAADFGRCIIASGTWTQGFNAASTLGDGWFVEYRNNGTGVITLDPFSSETVDGVATLQLAPGETCCIYSNGTALYTLGRTASAQQSQVATAFTSSGTAPSFALTPVPALTAYAAGQRFRVRFHSAGAGSDTLNISTLGAKSLKQYDATGAKVAAVIAANQLADVEYDSTDFVILDPLPAAAPGLQGAFKNLSAGADGVSSTVTAWMDECVVKDGGGTPRLLSSLALSINLTAAGANGLDTGTAAASSWYSLWVAYNPTAQTVAGIAALCPVLTGSTTAGSAVVTGLASTASMRVGMPVSGGNIPAGSVIKSVDSGSQVTLTNKALTTVASAGLTFVYDPVMPAGYTMRARFGMTRTDSTANKYPLSFVQYGRNVQYRLVAGSNVTAFPVLASNIQGNPATPTWAPVGLSGFVPATGSIAKIRMSCQTANQFMVCAPSGAYGGVASLASPPFTLSPGGNNSLNIVEVPVTLESGTIYVASGASSAAFLSTGWEDNL